jgi:putative endonuclease
MTGTFTVYVLLSEKFHKTYVGQTNNLDERIQRHNRGFVNSTKRFRPWCIIYIEKYETRSEAMKCEQWLKSGKGRAFVKNLIAPAEADGRKGVVPSTRDRSPHFNRARGTNPCL